MAAFIIAAVLYVILVWRLLTAEDRLRKAGTSIDDLVHRVGHLEDRLALLRNEQLLEMRRS
jgi:hypothetical protein